jgi:hypothetical protein
MGEGTSLFNLLFLGAALLLVLLTGTRVPRTGGRRPREPAEGQRAATVGMLIWLGLFGLACYLIFG